MLSKEQSEFIRKSKIEYRKLKPIECPAFGYEEIVFNNYGFDHIFYKGRIPRSREESEKRFNLLLNIGKILKNTKVFYSIEKRVKDKSIAHFWTIKSKKANNSVRIIIRQLNNGPLHFFSIMSE